MATGGYQYCTLADLQNRLSLEGVTHLLDDDGDGALTPTELALATECIKDASGTVSYYTWQKYAPNALAGNDWVKRRTVDLGVYVLCGRRANPIPDSVQQKAEKAEEVLQKILETGKALIPFAPLRRRLAPVWSNSRVVVGYRFKVIRVDPQTSSDRGTTHYAPNIDWEALHTFEV